MDRTHAASVFLGRSCLDLTVLFEIALVASNCNDNVVADLRRRVLGLCGCATADY
jgi:hypothetical protein